MGTETLIVNGFGSFGGGVNNLPTMGFTVGAAIVPVSAFAGQATSRLLHTTVQVARPDGRIHPDLHNALTTILRRLEDRIETLEDA